MAQSLLGLRADDMLDTVTHTRVSVGNTSTMLVARNSQRRWLLFVNDSSEVVYVSLTEPAMLHYGIRLEPNGGKLEFSLCNSNECPNPVYAIQGKTTPKTVLVTEGV